jgi:hypothetical protein
MEEEAGGKPDPVQWRGRFLVYENRENLWGSGKWGDICDIILVTVQKIGRDADLSADLS